MLVEFSVQNYLSFKDKTTLSMEATSDRELPSNVVENAQGSGLRLLRSAVVYGANASGKSNLVKALAFMEQMVTGSEQNYSPDSRLPVSTFKLDEACWNLPAGFEIVFLKNGTRYLYGFSLDEHGIQEEWLYSYPKKRRRVLFERDESKRTLDEPSKGYYFGEHWKGEGIRLTGLTRSKALFISVAYRFNHPLAEIVVKWFSHNLQGINPNPVRGSEELYTIKQCDSKSYIKGEVLKLIQNADLDIQDFRIEFLDLKTVLADPNLPPNIRDELVSVASVEKEKTIVLEVLFQHQGMSLDQTPMTVPINLVDESDGTRKIFALAGPLVHVLNEGCCLAADELDVHLHPHLTHGIIQLFHDESRPNKEGQLIFTTHDVSLLDKKLFRRDQIWFTEKNESGATSLYSAWDYKIRKDESLSKGYLAGRYGAVPYIEKLLD